MYVQSQLLAGTYNTYYNTSSVRTYIRVILLIMAMRLQHTTTTCIYVCVIVEGYLTPFYLRNINPSYRRISPFRFINDVWKNKFGIESWTACYNSACAIWIQDLIVFFLVLTTISEVWIDSWQIYSKVHGNWISWVYQAKSISKISSIRWGVWFI